jgi:putative transposase
MPRQARVFQRSLCYHIMNRGINRRELFAGEVDREKFLSLIRDYKAICGAKVYHWALMGNHYHMLIEVVYENLRGFVGGIQQCYAQYHHSTYREVGVFWGSRYQSKAVEIGEYLGMCARYIERNPVRAGLVTEPWSYRWSSAAHYVYSRSDGVTDTNVHFGEMSSRDRKVYAQTLMSDLYDDLMKRNETSPVIGSLAFSARIKLSGGRQRRKRGRPVECANIPIRS